MVQNRKPSAMDAAAREAKLAEALRANLRRRKSASQPPRTADAPAKPAED